MTKLLTDLERAYAPVQILGPLLVHYNWNKKDEPSDRFKECMSRAYFGGSFEYVKKTKLD